LNFLSFLFFFFIFDVRISFRSTNIEYFVERQTGSS